LPISVGAIRWIALVRRPSLKNNSNAGCTKFIFGIEYSSVMGEEVRMKLKHLFTVNIFFAVFFGITCAFFAGWALRIYGLAPDVGSLWTTRLAGGSILGFASLMWFGRKSDSVKARRAIALALLVQDSVGFTASLLAQLSGNLNALGWSNPVLYGLLALGYAYFVFIRPDRA
jgi:hypothetical protein